MKTSDHIIDAMQLIVSSRIPCIIGILSHERRKNQWVRIEVTAEFDPIPAIETGQVRYTIDYRYIESICRFILKTGRFSLLESALSALVQTLVTSEHTRSASIISVTLTKPSALPRGALATLRLSQQICGGGVRQCDDVDVIARLENRVISRFAQTTLQQVSLALGPAFPTSSIFLEALSVKAMDGVEQFRMIKLKPVRRNSYAHLRKIRGTFVVMQVL